MTEEAKKHARGAYLIYLGIVAVAFAAFTIVFLFLPRTRYSELEKRDLAEFPDYRNYKGNISQLPRDISTWFSDSEPFRDQFMTLSMGIRDFIGFNMGDPEEAVSFKPADSGAIALKEAESEEELLEAAGNPLADANAKTANSGIIVVGTGDNVRALMAFGGTPAMGNSFVSMASEYAKAFPGVKIYALIPPSATEFYLPDKAASLSKPAKPVLDYIAEHLPAGVKLVDAYSYLAAHTNEDIYLRTDHHWAPLGAFYGAKAFAREAGVPFKELSSYDKHVIKRYVGSMYGYSKDIAVKNAPEDFIYYIPKGLDYKTTYITYKTNKDYRVSSASKPYYGEFFHKFGDGSGNAYLTFMGGDQHLVKVNTGTNSNRKLLIIKDSFGNPVPGYLFYSFGEVHIADFRYFLPNMKKYVKDNGITDILFAFNIFNAVTPTNMSRVTRLLNQDGNLAPATVESSENNDSQEKQQEPSDEPVKNEPPTVPESRQEETSSSDPAN